MTYLIESNGIVPFHDDTCRLCGQSDENLWNIYEANGGNMDFNLPKKILSCLGIVVDINDGLPELICGKCMAVVQCFYEYRQECLLHDKMLRESLQNLHNHILPNLITKTPEHPNLENAKRDSRADAEENTSSPNVPERQRNTLETSSQDENCKSYPVSEFDSECIQHNEFHSNVAIVTQLHRDWSGGDSPVPDVLQESLEKEFPWRLSSAVSSRGENVCSAPQADIESETKKCLLTKEKNMHLSRTGCSLDNNFDKSVHGSMTNTTISCGNVTSEDHSKMISDVVGDQFSMNIVSGDMLTGRISQKESDLWVCNLCSKELKSLQLLQEHVMRHYSYLQCMECPLTFESAEELNNHKAQHVSSSLVLGFTCKQCHKSFRKEHLLKKHSAIEHSSSYKRVMMPKKFRQTCGKCERVFYSSVEMENHDESCGENQIQSEEESMEDEEPTAASKKKSQRNKWDCYLCILTFENVGQLTYHFKKVHNGKKPLKCNISGCEKLFETHIKLLKHRKNHHSNGFSCDKCKRVFPRSDRLRRHEALHLQDQERSYECEICDRSFLTKSHLSLHIYSNHTKILECSECGKTFNKLYNLERHKVCHTQDFSFMCDVCGDKFRHQESLRKHAKKHEPQKYNCSVCQKLFISIKELKLHEDRHRNSKSRPFKCELCDCNYKLKNNLRRHYKRNHPDL